MDDIRRALCDASERADSPRMRPVRSVPATAKNSSLQFRILIIFVLGEKSETLEWEVAHQSQLFLARAI